MPTTDRPPTDVAPDASADGPARTEATRPATPVAPDRAPAPSTLRAATPGTTDCPHCGTGTINCQGRLDCPDCAWTEARSAK